MLRLDPSDFIRRCWTHEGVQRGAAEFHAWDVRTGEASDHPCSVALWDQMCPLHGGENTVQHARQSGIPEYAAILCRKD